MSSTADTADWVRNERRKQNAVVLLVILACLAIAFFPRNERRLFTFPGTVQLAGTIDAPAQTSLRAGIFDGPSAMREAAPAQPRHEMVLPLSQPAIDFPVLSDSGPDDLRPAPLAFPVDLPEPAGLPATGASTMGGFPAAWSGPFMLAGGGGSGGGGGGGGGGGIPPGGGGGVIPGAVPEPGTWALLIGGIGLVAWRMRAVHLRRLKRRGHLHWRRHLLPASARR